MTDHSGEVPRRVTAEEIRKNTHFPIFNVNVPMPAGTAVPAGVQAGGQADRNNGADAPAEH